VSHSRLSRRVTDIAESSTLAVDAKARALTLSGVNVVSFGAGEPDFPTPKHIVDAAADATRRVANHRYSATGGTPELREAVARKTTRDSGYEVNASNVLICNGAKHALYNAFMTLLEPGDEVLLPSPYWVSYPEMIGLAGGAVVKLMTTEETGFRVTVDQLDAARTPRTKALVFVSPSNPTGAVYPPSEVEAIGRWAVDAGVWVIADEIYEHLVYGDNSFSSMPVSTPALSSRCIVVNGVSKTFAMTGWRVGWMIGAPDLVSGASSLQSHMTSNVNNVAQAAALAAVEGDLLAVEEMREAFDRRRTTMHELLNAIPGVVCHEPGGAFYCFPSVMGVLDRGAVQGRPVRDDIELADALLDLARVALVPGSGFGAPGYMRLSYALSDDDLLEGLTRLADALR
jgi:aspartate aminotransferase